MGMQTKHTFIFTLLLGLGWAGFLFAYQNGPDPGVNGILGRNGLQSGRLSRWQSAQRGWRNSHAQRAAGTMDAR